MAADDHDPLSLEPLDIKVKPAKDHFGPPSAYKNSSNPRGAVFIANYINFTNPDLYVRTGSEVNVSQLEHLFTQMNYEVVDSKVNQTKDDTMKSLEVFRNSDIHKDADSMVVIFMSHGRENEFFTSDGELIHYKQVCNMFSNKNCPAMSGKPKLFMFHFCRNKQKEEQDKTKPTKTYSTVGNRHREKITCTFVCHSTAEGQKAYRYYEHGALFFHHTCKVFMDHAKDMEFFPLMRMVTKALSNFQPADFNAIGVTDAFYFNPPMDVESKLPPISSTSSSQAKSSLLKKKVHLCADGLDADEEVYKMSGPKQGLVLIVNNLEGCKRDVKNLCTVFTQLGFDVKPPVSNASYEELMKQIDAFKRDNHFDSSVIIFYGHGFEDHIVTSDGLAIKQKDLLNNFSDKNCPKLAGKPKLFFFQSCFTTDDSYPVDRVFSERSNNSVFAQDSEEEEEGAVAQDVNRDMMVFNVEVEGGNCENGSLLTDVLYQVLLNSQNVKFELLHLLRLVTGKLDEMSEGKFEDYFVVVSNIKFHKDFFFRLKETCCHDGPNHTSARKRITNIECGKFNINIKESRHLMIGDDIYQSTSNPRGKAIIFGFTDYKSHEIPQCDWHSYEIATLEELSRKLGYSTHVCRNLTHEQIQSELRHVNACDEDLKEVNSIVVAVVGFGCDVKHFYDEEGNKVPALDVLHNFTDSQCPSLKGKSKIFYFHLTKIETWKDVPMMKPKEDLQDTFTCYLMSTLQNDVHPSEGLKTLCRIFESKASTTDLETMLMEAEEQLSKDGHEKIEKFIIKSVKVFKEFYFNPKSYIE